MLDYCQCKPSDLTAIYDTLTKDSQAGTVLAQEAIQKHARDIREIDFAELNWHLQNHTLINKADFELANTLKI